MDAQIIPNANLLEINKCMRKCEQVSFNNLTKRFITK